MVRVLIVDDSAFARISIARQLSSDLEIEVAGVAGDGIAALEKIRELSPDVVTLDVEMPRMNGLETLERIMVQEPTPVVMLSNLTSQGSAIAVRALELGAVDFFLKASPANPAGFQVRDSDLATKVKLAASVGKGKLKVATAKRESRPRSERLPARSSDAQGKVIVIGSSTGGPAALYELIPSLPGELPAAMLVIQHMPSLFTRSLANRLNQLSEIEVKEAEPGDSLQKGLALVAPGGYHLVVKKDEKIGLSRGAPVLGLRPAVDVTMQSVARFYGTSVIGVVLTGMGSDGTRGAALIKAAGGQIIAQDEATSIVYGMPRSVVEAGSADSVLPLEQIAGELVKMCQRN